MTKLKEKIGFIGFGNMGFAILSGLKSKKLIDFKQIYVFDPNLDRLRLFEKEGVAIHTCLNNVELVEAVDIVILAVKPQEIETVTNEIKNHLTPEKIIISILAGTPISKLKKLFGNNRTIVRAMPNLAAIAGQSMTAITSDSKDALSKANAIFEACGSVLELPEKDFDLVTAVSGSGPAYFFFLMEILSDFAQKNGIAKEKADQLAIQTALGASALAFVEGQHFAEKDSLLKALRERVTSKGGTTEAALKVLFEKSLPNIFEEALKNAIKRSKELSGG